MKIVLIGYMASGKSTVGKRLADLKSFSFYDLDTYIEIKEEMDVDAIFSKKGEIYFRKKESYYLREVLEKEENLVLATGGGTPCYGNNMEMILRATTHTHYLKLSIATIVERLDMGKDERPLVKDIHNGELSEFVGKHLFERSFFYNQANNVISCDGRSPSEIASIIDKTSI